MTERANNRGAAMMIVGGLMIAFAVATILLTNNPVPSTIVVIGLVSMGVGARRRSA